MNKSKKSVLVTGAAGFIGTNLVSRLLDDGHRVIGIDNFVTGKKKNLDQFNKEPRFIFYEKDVRRQLTLREPIDLIYNLACPASPPSYQKNSLLTLESAILGMRNVLVLATTKKALVVQASTSEIYGDPLEHPQKENYWGNVNPVGPRSCYDEGKRAGETYCYEFVKAGGEARVVRIFNTYGPFMDPNDGRVVTNFITQALAGKPLTVFGAGDQTRSFCYVDDLVEGLIRVGFYSKPLFGPLNLGNPNEVTILQLAQKILKLTSGKSEQIIYKCLPKDDPTRRCPDIGQARKILNWEPRVDLEVGLKKTIDYLNKQLKD